MQYSDDFDFEEEKKKPSSRVFPIVLSICLIAVCGVAVAAFANSISTDEAEQPKTTVSTTTTSKTVQQVVKPATNIPDDRTTTVTTNATTVAEKELFVFPVSNRVLQKYSETHVFSQTLEEWVTHNGVDFEAQADDPVKSIADGEIVNICQDVLWGDTVEIQHEGNVLSRYYGVTAKNIEKGQSVKAGDVIGVVSSIPSEVIENSHIHLETLANGSYIDPLTMLSGEIVVVDKK